MNKTKTTQIKIIGMFINLSDVLLRFSLSILKKSTDAKLSKISCQFLKQKMFNNAFIEGTGNLDLFKNEVPIVISEEDITFKDVKPDNVFFNEVFFMTHIALNIGINQGHIEIRNVDDILASLRNCEKTLKKSSDTTVVTSFKRIIMTANGPAYQKVVIKQEEELNEHLNFYSQQKFCLRTTMKAEMELGF